VSRKTGGFGQFDPPYGPSLIERAFGFDESWGVSSENPDMGIWRQPKAGRFHEKNNMYLASASNLIFTQKIIANK